MYHNPVKVIKTISWDDQCRSLINKLELKNPIIITSKGHLERQNLSTIFNNNSILGNIKQNPTFESCQLAVNFSQGSKYDGVIAFGGGSVLDTAKVVMASLGTGNADITRLLKFNTPFNNKIPSIFIPTTHGTGSEVTMWGTVWNIDEKRKYSISHPDLYPDYAILDSSLTMSLPLEISIITIMDALSHCFEAIWNKNSNSISNNFAIEGICLILNNVENLKKNPSDLPTRTKLLDASNIAGLAFSNTATAAAHAISYPLTIDFDIPHGIASSISLLPLIRLNKDFIKQELNLIINKLKKSNLDELEAAIENITVDMKKFKLQYWGVTQSDLDNIVKESFANDRIQNNIQSLSRTDVKDILLKVYNNNK